MGAQRPRGGRLAVWCTVRPAAAVALRCCAPRAAGAGAPLVRAARVPGGQGHRLAWGAGCRQLEPEQECATMSAVVVSQPHKEIVGEGKNAKYIKDCTELHLGGRGIERLAGFAQFVNLEVLWLNDNRLQRLGGLNANFRIRRLYAQGNQIDSLKGSLAHFKFLQVLDLENNHLHDLDRVLAVLSHFNFLNNLTLKVRPHASLSSERAAARRRRTAYADASSCPLSCPRCACLASQGNPCCEEEAYRLRVIFSIPSLHILDCHAVKERERATARRRFGTGGVEKLSIAKSKDL